MNATKIEWTQRTWNPVTGCTKVSAGCDHCYAEGIARRFAGTPAFPYGFDVTLHPERLTAPLRWRKPALVFVNSMSDLFHDEVSEEFVRRVFATMAAAPQHTFQVLTKRPGRMRSLLSRPDFEAITCDRWLSLAGPGSDWVWPLPNVWLGVSVEDQKWAAVRIPLLLDTPVAVRFLSCEPLLGPIDLTRGGWLAPDEFDRPGVTWVIVGGESGAGARPMHPRWARDLRDQCTATSVPFFYKQHGAWVEVDNPTHYVTEDGALHDVHTASGIGCLEPVPVRRLGKGSAGRVLDGRTWDEYPAGLA